MAKKIIEVMDTTYRDGFQSVFGGRVQLKDFLPSIEAALEAGIRHFESGGGARFQSLYFYLNEDAFFMMDEFRRIVGPDVKLQTLARGVNTVSLDTGSREMIDLHAKLFKKHGVSHVRNFDALNDWRNLEYSAKAIKSAGLHHEMTITLMDLPPKCSGAHDVSFYEKTLRAYLDHGIPYDSVVFKDASGTSNPNKIYETIQMARRLLPEGTHIRLHTHETANIGVAAYLAAIEAGADGIDLAREPVSGGTSQPDILVLMHALKGKDYALGNHLGEPFDLEKILQSEMVLKECLKDYFFPPEAKQVSAMIQFSPMPGGALTANTQMMRDNNILDKFPEVIKEMREVVEKGGYGTSVTPVSQFYFQQAYNNVMFGKWKKIADGYGRMVLGYFGKTPVAPDAEIVKIAQEQVGLEPTTRAAMDLANEDEKKTREYAVKVLNKQGIAVNDENIFIVLSCGRKGITYLKGDGPLMVRKLGSESGAGAGAGSGAALKDPAQKAAATSADYTVTVNGETFTVNVKEGAASGAHAVITTPTHKLDTSTQKAYAAFSNHTQTVSAPLPGTVLKLNAKPNQTVKKDEILLVLEAMKMETEIKSPCDGVIKNVLINAGETVENGQILVEIAQ